MVVLFLELDQEKIQQSILILFLQDLQLLGQIVDLASQRGAFRGNELSQVGAVYDKLSAFLGYVAEQQEANAEEGENAGDEEASAGEE